MPRLILRMLALVAVLLMPAGMGAAPALAQPAPSADGEHCGDHQQPVEDKSTAQVHCMACSALPALEVSTPPAMPMPRAPKVIARTRFVSGIVLEIATPPPKLS